jgi:hypothetical protein
VVLRGSGSGIDGTILYSSAELQPHNPLQIWTGKAPIAITNPKTISPKTAKSHIEGKPEINGADIGRGASI